MMKNEGRESKEEDLVILSLQESFCSSVEVIKASIRDLHVSTLVYQKEEVDFPQLFIHDVDAHSARTFV